MWTAPKNSDVGDPTEQVRLSSALSPSLETHSEYLCLLKLHFPQRVVGTVRLNAAHVPKRALQQRDTAVAKRHHTSKLDATSTTTRSAESPRFCLRDRPYGHHLRFLAMSATSIANKLFNVSARI